MPPHARWTEGGPMKITLAVLAAALALLVPATASAADRVLDLLPVGTNVSVLFEGESADGSRVFVQTTEALVPEDGDSMVDLYEIVNGAPPVLLSDRVQPGPDALDGQAKFKAASPDGTHVFFATTEPLVAADTDTADDIYDRSAGTTTLLSDRVQTGPDAEEAVFFEGASPDRTRLVFRTNEAILTQDGDPVSDLYQYSGGTTTMLSDRVQAGADEPKPASFGGISDDGSHVFFETDEALMANDGDASTDVYQRVGS